MLSKFNLGTAYRFSTLVDLSILLFLYLLNLSNYSSARFIFQSRRVSFSQHSYRRILSGTVLRHELQTTPNPFPRKDRLCLLSQISRFFLPLNSLP
jgi:hypothetical protein